MTKYPTEEQRRSPAYCPIYAKRSPSIPFHNGDPCLRCGAKRQPDGTWTKGTRRDRSRGRPLRAV